MNLDNLELDGRPLHPRRRLLFVLRVLVELCDALTKLEWFLLGISAGLCLAALTTLLS